MVLVISKLLDAIVYAAGLLKAAVFGAPRNVVGGERSLGGQQGPAGGRSMAYRPAASSEQNELRSRKDKFRRPSELYQGGGLNLEAPPKNDDEDGSGDDDL